MREIGEVWIDKPFEVEKKGNEVLFKAIHNVTTQLAWLGQSF
jgi:hypothetical protein